MFDDFSPSLGSALAAIDIGSNSFRLEIGHISADGYRRQHCSKEMVSLGKGLDAQGMLSREACDRGLRCLRKFATQLARLQPAQVRVVATQTLREARNREEFLRRAEALLGQPVEVISGQEEARLIYAGVSFLHPSQRRRLVIDIGGRSTELIVGQARAQTVAQSFQVGSASISQQFFPEGRITAARFRAAQLAVAQVLESALAPFGAAHWDEAIGASGTVRTVSAVLQAAGITDGTLTPDGLRWLIERCIEVGNTAQLALPGLKPQRRPLLPGGLCILYALVVHCGITQLRAAKGALRQGVIVDLYEAGLTQHAPAVRALREAASPVGLAPRMGSHEEQTLPAHEKGLKGLRAPQRSKLHAMSPMNTVEARRELA